MWWCAVFRRSQIEDLPGIFLCFNEGIELLLEMNLPKLMATKDLGNIRDRGEESRARRNLDDRIRGKEQRVIELRGIWLP
jgi:hypothetical protein